jgi:hypothetical protein
MESEQVKIDSSKYDDNLLSNEEFCLLSDKIKKMSKLEPKNIKELITKYLSILGLHNFKLKSIEDIKSQVKNIIESENIEYCNKFESQFKLDGTIDERNINLTMKVRDSNTEIKKFTLIRDLSGLGYWNKIKLYKDENNKHYIFRSAVNRKEWAREPDDEYLYRSFNENLKHVILYFLLKYNYPHIKYKIVPEIYYFGLYKNPKTNEKTFITCMEVGTMTLDEYFESIPTNYPEIQRVLFTVFRSLELLNDLGLEFKHGDLKYNNILMSNKNKPLIIDFGRSRFKLDDLLFEINDDMSTHYEDPYINVTHDMMQLLCSLFILKKDVEYTLTRSKNKKDYIIDIYEIFKFVKNKNSYILESEVMEKIMKDKYKEYYIPFQSFYLAVDLNVLKEYATPGISLKITSSELAENLGLVDIEDEVIFDKYEKKYLKYKLKYLKLKRKLNI